MKMPDLAQAKFAEEQKLAAKLREPGPSQVESVLFSLANSGIPKHAATLLAIHFAKLEQRIAELEKAAAAPHLRKQEKR
jgi:hypothetical protein